MQYKEAANRKRRMPNRMPSCAKVCA